MSSGALPRRQGHLRHGLAGWRFSVPPAANRAPFGDYDPRRYSSGASEEGGAAGGSPAAERRGQSATDLPPEEAYYLDSLRKFREDNCTWCFGPQRDMPRRRRRRGLRKYPEEETSLSYDTSERSAEDFYDAGHFIVDTRLFMHKLRPASIRFEYSDIDEQGGGEGSRQEAHDEGETEETKPAKVSLPKRVIYHFPRKDEINRPHRRKSFDPDDSLNVSQHLHRAYKQWIPDRRAAQLETGNKPLRTEPAESVRQTAAGPTTTSVQSPVPL